MASWPKWRRAVRMAAAWLAGRRRSGRLEMTELKSPWAGIATSTLSLFNLQNHLTYSFCVHPQDHFERESLSFDTRCFRQRHEPYALAQTSLADGALQGFAVERRE